MSGFRIQGLGLGFQGSGFQGSGFQGLGLRVSVFRVSGFRLSRFQGLGFWDAEGFCLVRPRSTEKLQKTVQPAKL